MGDIENRYKQMLYERDYPRPVPQPAAAPAKPLGDQTGRPDLAALAAMDVLPGLLKGAVAATLGLPGDVESLIRLLSGGEQKLPTTEDVQKMLPPVVPAGAKGEAADYRRDNAAVGENIGEFLPLAPVAAAGKVVRAVGKKGAAKAAAGSTAAAAPESAGDRVINYDAGGNRK